jgi:hypothetical protein
VGCGLWIAQTDIKKRPARTIELRGTARNIEYSRYSDKIEISGRGDT